MEAHGVRTIRESGLIQSIKLILDQIKKKEQLGNLETINTLTTYLQTKKTNSSQTTQGLLDAANTLVKELTREHNLEKDAMIRIVAEELRKRYRITQKAYTKLNKAKNLLVPLSIFTAEAGILETLALYLREQVGLSFTEIGQTLRRDPTTIWTAYHKALKKNITIKKTTEEEANIPLSIFGQQNLTMFESLVFYLKEKDMKFVEIGHLLRRDQRNIWSTYKRATTKRNNNQDTVDKEHENKTKGNKKEETI